jgi:hypothetical protein
LNSSNCKRYSRNSSNWECIGVMQHLLKKVNMKYVILIFTLTMLITACKQTKEDVVENLISESAKYDKENVGKILSDDFIYSDKKENDFNKTEYLSRLDSLKNITYKSKILTFQDLDSIVKTEEEISTIFDSIMEGIPSLIQKKTYRFIDQKLKRITVDTTLNFDSYILKLNEKIAPLLYYVQTEYDIQDKNEIFKNLKKYINEFGSLTQSDKNKYKKYSSVQGTFIGEGIINKFEFKKEHCNFMYFGFSMNGKYSIDEDFVFIEASELGNISLKIIDHNTLSGEGLFASGLFKRTK